ncbi:MAG TPA: DUF3068 domain-containing protein, partial [Thermoplasmatales archaeon]|nr:DUF3068 domain-containing protein [Thermoplasmatales archaeon]
MRRRSKSSSCVNRGAGKNVSVLSTAAYQVPKPETYLYKSRIFLRHIQVKGMKGKRNIMIVVGLVFFIIAPSFSFVLTPSMKKIPDNLHEVVYYEGKLGMLNTSTLNMDYTNIGIKREVNAIKKEGDVLLIREDVTVKDKRTGKEIPDLSMTTIYGIDPRTSKNVPGYGDTERVGQWIFPVGVKKKDYLVWNSDMDEPYREGYVDVNDAAGIAHYMGEKEIAGVKTYE